MKTIRLNNTARTAIIKEAVNALAKGKLVIYPTDTCYGLGADALNPKAVDKIIRFKGDRKGKPISVAVADSKMAARYIKINPSAKNIFQNLLPGPVTAICQGKHRVDPRLESSLGTLGIRIPNHSQPLAIIKSLGRPITATSANVSGKKTPYRIDEIVKNLSPAKKSLIGLIIDAGQLPPNPPSVVVDTTLDEPAILRRGKINFHRLGAKTIISGSKNETRSLAKTLFQKHSQILSKRCLVFALQGELGSGKTQFAKGIGSGLKIKQIVKSPTFNIVHEYPFKTNGLRGIFYHIDTWRVRQKQTLEGLEWKEMVRPGNVVAIEWMEKSKQILDKLAPKTKAKIIRLEIRHLSPTKRQIKIAD